MAAASGVPAVHRAVTIRHPGQSDLLSWKAPDAAPAFDRYRVRAATLEAVLARAVGETLRMSELSRREIALRMGAFLGETVSENVLNAYASPARAGHTISLPRFLALLHVTGDARLLNAIAEPAGFAAVDRRFLTLIELASLREHEDQVARQRKHLQARARATGVI